MNNNTFFLIDEDTLQEDDEIYAEAMSDGVYATEAMVDTLPNEEPAPVAWTPSDAVDVIVDKLLRETRYYREEIAEIEGRAKAEIARIQEQAASLTRRFRFSLQRREISLEAFFAATGHARRVSPCGTLKLKKGSERVRFIDCDGEIVDDETRAIAGIDSPALKKIEISIRKTEVKAALTGKGDFTDDERRAVAELAVMDRAPSKFVIEVPKA